MKFANVIFDFDGTLVDSRSGVVKSFKRVIKELSSKAIEEEAIVRLMGTPLAQIISVLLETKDKSLIDKGSDLFKKYYRDDGLYKNIVYPGVKDVLEFLKEQSCQLFVVSNKIEAFMDKILKQHNMDRYFLSGRGTSGTDSESPKADIIKKLLADYKLNNQETVMIGDTENDISAAKENFIFSVGVTWGYGTKESLINAKANKIINKPIELKQFLK